MIIGWKCFNILFKKLSNNVYYNWFGLMNIKFQHKYLSQDSSETDNSRILQEIARPTTSAEFKDETV